MARSPSPGYSSRRRDDRYARDRRDGGRRRSRSRSPDRRYRDRDAHRRRERTPDSGSYRPSRRDDATDRRRSRDRSLGRDRRYRSRDRDTKGGDPRDRRDDTRDRARRRRDGSTDSRRKGRRDDSRERGSHKVAESKAQDSPKSITPSKKAEEDKKKAERLAKLEEWKKKQAAEREKKQKDADGAAGTRNLLEEMDKKAAASPTVVSKEASPAVQSPAPSDGPQSPAPYAGKFDPKAIAKKAVSGAASKSALGIDVALPPKVNGLATTKTPLGGSLADKTKLPAANAPTNLVPLKAKGNLSGFGFGSKAQAEAERSNKRALDFGDEESTRKKLERLPTPPPTDQATDDAALANGATGEAEDDEDADMVDADDEEKAAAAARAAAEKRDERLLEQSRAVDGGDEDIAMTDAPATNGTEAPAPEVIQPDEEEEEDVDPLDAFMSGLTDPLGKPRAGGAIRGKIQQQQEPEALFSDNEGEPDAADADPDEILAMTKARKKKDIPAVNHAKMNYETVRKDFYTEPTEIAEMTEDEVLNLRFELDGIKVRGVDVPKPVTKWSQCGLGVQVLDVIQKLGYTNPTSIQSQAIPAIMSGRDVIGIAKTGSGKTVAFLLPMFRHIKDQRPLDTLEGPIGLIMTPTRELATQIFRECKPYLKALNLRAVCAYGGAPIKDQIADLKRGAEIVVCTPGRMIDLLAANSGRVTNLKRVTYVVLDEADRMFDMGFEPQVMKVLANIRPQRQTVLFSATFPRNMEALARKVLTKPVEIVVGGRSVVAPEITQIVEVRTEETKFVRVLQLLGDLHEKDEDARTLIFVDRQEAADGLLRDLMRKGYPCMSIHGGKDQIDRDSAIDDFKAGVIPVLIATSVAARGLDVKQLKLVINYDTPNHLEDYVHRAGRTGRAGNTGTAVTFVTPDQEKYSVDIAKALRQSGQPIPEDLQKLVDSFMEKVKAGKEKASGSGFGGKGLERLDQERDAARNRERKTYKTGDDDAEEEKEDKNKDDDIVVKSATAPAAPVSIPGVPKGIDLDGKITVHKTEVPSNTSKSSNPLDRVAAAVANIHGRLNQNKTVVPGQHIDNKGPDAGAFHATLEINDFPQKARWAVTNRTNVAKILEATGTSITTKGSFYPTGKEPGAGENPKLYILVEGDTEVVVTNAMRELMRLLKEGTIAAADSDARAPASGRYSVV